MKNQTATEGPRVLVVEDESIIARDIVMSLKSLGYDVAGVRVSGEAALDFLRGDRADIVLMDIVLQGRLDGIETAERIRNAHNIPVIYLTAYANSDIMERARLTTPFGYLIKPFEDNELHFTMQMALYKHRMEEMLRRSEEQYRTIVETANIVPVELDIETRRFNYVGPQAEKLFGYGAKEWTGLDFLISRIHPEDRETAISNFIDEAVSSKHRDFEFRVLAADGRTLWMRGFASLAPTPENRILRCVMFDISDRKLAEQERERLIAELKEALGKIKTLRGLLPICAWCKKIRDDNGYWKQVETYVQEHSEAEFTHGMCPECQSRLSEDLDAHTPEP